MAVRALVSLWLPTDLDWRRPFPAPAVRGVAIRTSDMKPLLNPASRLLFSDRRTPCNHRTALGIRREWCGGLWNARSGSSRSVRMLSVTRASEGVRSPPLPSRNITRRFYLSRHSARPTETQASCKKSPVRTIRYATAQRMIPVHSSLWNNPR